VNFYNSENLIWLWALPLIAVLLFYSAFRVKRILSLFATARVAELMGYSLSPLRVFVKACLVLFVFSLLVVALARPRLGFDWKEMPRGGADIMVVLDLSKSMMASDISPSRLERAKREISDLIGMLEGDRIGVIPFAGVSYVSCPLTSDYRLATLFLNQLSFESMPVQGTDIFSAVKMAAESLDKSSGANSEAKAIILMTDGEDNEGSLDELVAFLKPKGIKVFAIGIGGLEGAPIPEDGGGFKKDESGRVVLTKLDESYLKQLSLATGGAYIRSTSGDMDLDFIYKKNIRKDLSESEDSKDLEKQKVWHERYQWFLFLAVLLFLLEHFTSDYRREKEGFL